MFYIYYVDLAYVQIEFGGSHPEITSDSDNVDDVMDHVINDNMNGVVAAVAMKSQQHLREAEVSVQGIANNNVDTPVVRKLMTTEERLTGSLSINV